MCSWYLIDGAQWARPLLKITGNMISVTMHTVAIGTAWLLPGPHRNGRATLLPVSKTFTVFAAHLRLQSPQTFLRGTENFWW